MESVDSKQQQMDNKEGNWNKKNDKKRNASDVKPC